MAFARVASREVETLRSDYEVFLESRKNKGGTLDEIVSYLLSNSLIKRAFPDERQLRDQVRNQLHYIRKFHFDPSDKTWAIAKYRDRSQSYESSAEARFRLSDDIQASGVSHAIIAEYMRQNECDAISATKAIGKDVRKLMSEIKKFPKSRKVS